MSSLRRTLKRSGLPVLLVLCLAALSVSYASADEAARPRALQIIGDPDAAVNGRFAVGTASVGSKALTVVGVIDFLGAGTVHNYFTQGTGSNMQINTNVDESNVVGDASRSQWKLVLGSSLDWFSIRRSPAGATYNEDALFFIQGSTGNVGIARVDTGNNAAIPFTPLARLHVETDSGNAIIGHTAGPGYGVTGQSDSTSGRGVAGWASATTGANYGVYGLSTSTDGYGVYGLAFTSTGHNYGVYGDTCSTDGYGVYGNASNSSGTSSGVYGRNQSSDGFGVYGYGFYIGVLGKTTSSSGYGVYSDGDLHATGDLSAEGTKSAIVETEDYGWRHLYAMESPQNWFEDFGQATLVAGEAVVAIEQVFAQTVNLGEAYHVFLTPLGEGCTLFVVDKSSTAFTVRANEGVGCEITFDYRIIAPRLGYEGLRLEPAEDPETVAASLPSAPPEPATP